MRGGRGMVPNSSGGITRRRAGGGRDTVAGLQDGLTNSRSLGVGGRLVIRAAAAARLRQGVISFIGRGGRGAVQPNKLDVVLIFLRATVEDIGQVGVVVIGELKEKQGLIDGRGGLRGQERGDAPCVIITGNIEAVLLIYHVVTDGPDGEDAILRQESSREIQ